MTRYHPGNAEAEEPEFQSDQIWRMENPWYTDLAGFLLKVDFVEKCADGAKKSFRSLT